MSLTILPLKRHIRRRLGFAVEYFPHYINRKLHLHSVDVVLITFIIRGHGQHVIDKDTFVETGASMAVTHYGQRHCVLTDANGMDVMNVYLDLQHHPLPVLPRELQPVLPLILPLHPKFQHRLNRIVRLQFDDPQPLADMLFAIEREQEQQGPGWEEAARMYLRLFLMLACRHALKKGFIQPPPAPLEGVRQHLDEAFAESHTLDSLAKRARLSRTSLCRAFKAYTGKRVFDYLIERRIQAAMVALRGTDDKILTIALNCGFHDLAYFNRKFKQLVGVTPSAYRTQKS